MSEWYPGDLARLQLDVTDNTVDPAVAADPITVRFTVRPPPGLPLATYTYGASGSPIVRDAVGLYRLDVLLTRAGPWHMRAEGIGAGGPQLARELTINVRPSAVVSP